MWCKPTEKQLLAIPKLYSKESIPLKEKKIYMHFFLGGSDWYAAEYSPEDKIFFGFVILNGDYEMAEWGNFSFTELLGLKANFLEVDRDKFWKPKKAKDVEKICKAQGWSYEKLKFKEVN